MKPPSSCRLRPEILSGVRCLRAAKIFLHYFCDRNVVTSYYGKSTVRQKGKILSFLRLNTHPFLTPPQPLQIRSDFQHISVIILDLNSILEEVDLPD